MECHDYYDWSISTMCTILEIGRSSYYKWLNHEETSEEKLNKELIELIKFHNTDSKGILGYRRMTAWINEKDGYSVNHKRIKRLMDVVNIKAVIREKRKAFVSSTQETISKNELDRNFLAVRPNEKWLTDVSEFKVKGSSNKYYLSAIIDLYDLSIISYEISHRNDNRLVFDTFDKAFEKYPEAKPLVHSDRGYQYTSQSFKSKLKNQGCTQSMSRVGCCIDNGPIENFWGQLKTEDYYLSDYSTPEDLIEGIKKYIHFYNNERLQKRFNNKSPNYIREQALLSEVPEAYPIPLNNRIEKYWEALEVKQI